jgi:hypothetical protein
MKNIPYILIVFLISCSSNFQISANAKKTGQLFYISKIDSIGKVYLFYLKRGDSIFKVMSKEQDVKKCKPIKVGDLYYMKINSWFLPEEFYVKQRASAIVFNEQMIKIERDSVVSDLFTSENIIGKYYCDRPHRMAQGNPTGASVPPTGRSLDAD